MCVYAIRVLFTHCLHSQLYLRYCLHPVYPRCVIFVPYSRCDVNKSHNILSKFTSLVVYQLTKVVQFSEMFTVQDSSSCIMTKIQRAFREHRLCHPRLGCPKQHRVSQYSWSGHADNCMIVYYRTWQINEVNRLITLIPPGPSEEKVRN